MAEVKVFHDREGQTLTVWFAAPSLEYVSEEIGDDVVLMKDRSGRVIGFEKLNLSVPRIRLCTHDAGDRACLIAVPETVSKMSPRLG
jgi:Protein of unknown function (DUF2283)